MDPNLPVDRWQPVPQKPIRGLGLVGGMEVCRNDWSFGLCRFIHQPQTLLMGLDAHVGMPAVLHRQRPTRGIEFDGLGMGLRQPGSIVSPHDLGAVSHEFRNGAFVTAGHGQLGTEGVPKITTAPGQATCFVEIAKYSAEMIRVHPEAVRCREVPRTLRPAYIAAEEAHERGADRDPPIAIGLGPPGLFSNRLGAHVDDPALQVDVIDGQPQQFLAAQTSVQVDRDHDPNLGFLFQGLQLLPHLGQGQEGDPGRIHAPGGNRGDRIDAPGHVDVLGSDGPGEESVQHTPVLVPGLRPDPPFEGKPRQEFDDHRGGDLFDVARVQGEPGDAPRLGAEGCLGVL